MSVQTITPRELAEKLRSGRAHDLFDVRTPAEFGEVHAESAVNLPLDSLDAQAVTTRRRGPADEPLYFICKSGMRGGKACEKLAASGLAAVNVEGGTQAWEQAGLPVVRGKRKVISLERQVRIAAGFLVLLGVALGVSVHPGFLALSAFVGAGLMSSGITDTCGMAMMLAKCPWNR